MRTTIIYSIDVLIETINSFENNYIYRGHSDSDWNLTPSLVRLAKAWKGDAAKFRDFEKYSLQQFKSRYHLYCGDKFYRMNSNLEWLSAMQHYGAPTRLLDFTLSPYIALYFALEGVLPNQQKSISIYAINYSNLYSIAIGKLKRLDEEFSYSIDDLPNVNNEVFDKYIWGKTLDMIWLTEPNSLNTRLDRQQGCFLLSGKVEESLEEVLSTGEYADAEVYKYIIDTSVFSQIYALLRKTNTTPSVIYGDLHGLSLSIKNSLLFYGN